MPSDYSWIVPGVTGIVTLLGQQGTLGATLVDNATLAAALGGFSAYTACVYINQEPFRLKDMMMTVAIPSVGVYLANNVLGINSPLALSVISGLLASYSYYGTLKFWKYVPEIPLLPDGS